jgi:hypothetical protein
LYSNRQEARKLLNLKLDLLFNKENSKLSKQIDVLKKQKQNKRRKALKKYKP